MLEQRTTKDQFEHRHAAASPTYRPIRNPMQSTRLFSGWGPRIGA